MLAEGIAGLPGIALDVSMIETNIVRFGVTSRPAGDFVEKLYGKVCTCCRSARTGSAQFPI
jgi:threonine aldolase